MQLFWARVAILPTVNAGMIGKAGIRISFFFHELLIPILMISEEVT
jgi:hypothetical protein